MPLSLTPFTQPKDVLWGGWDSADGTLLGLAIFSKLNSSLHPCLEMGPAFVWQAFDLLVVHTPVQPSDEVVVTRSLGQLGNSLASGFLE